MMRAGERLSADCLEVRPSEVRLDISSLCQLRCVLCPVAHRDGQAFIGRGVLPLSSFREFIDANPGVQTLEIGSSGEVFLNRDLPVMLRYAHDKGVKIQIDQGSNLNDASPEALEALVKYGVSLLKVSIDGATQETYEKYRVGGDLRKVLRNVHVINGHKKRYGSVLPRLILQFIPFGHNEHEISRIIVMSKALGMELYFKINVFDGHLPLRDHALLTKLIGYSDTDSFFRKTGMIYMRHVCLQLWRSPQVSWDGRLLGCSHNVNGMFAQDALGGRFAQEVNNERMRYARMMHLGTAPGRTDIPCASCEVFADYRKYDQWLTPEEIRRAMDRPDPSAHRIG